MRESIADKAGIRFARSLCDELARQEQIDYALQAARTAIQIPLEEATRRETGSSLSAELSQGPVVFTYPSFPRRQTVR